MLPLPQFPNWSYSCRLLRSAFSFPLLPTEGLQSPAEPRTLASDDQLSSASFLAIHSQPGVPGPTPLPAASVCFARLRECSRVAASSAFQLSCALTPSDATRLSPCALPRHLGSSAQVQPLGPHSSRKKGQNTQESFRYFKSLSQINPEPSTFIYTYSAAMPAMCKTANGLLDRNLCS